MHNKRDYAKHAFLIKKRIHVGDALQQLKRIKPQ